MKKILLASIAFLLLIAFVYAEGCPDLDMSGVVDIEDGRAFKQAYGSRVDDGTFKYRAMADFDDDWDVDDADQACFYRYKWQYDGQTAPCSDPQYRWVCGCFQGCADLTGGPIPGTGDGFKGLMDLTLIGNIDGTCQGEADFNPLADFDGDGCVYLQDASSRDLIDFYCFDQSPVSLLTCNFSAIPGGCADLSLDGQVDFQDLSFFGVQMGKTTQDPDFNPLADFDDSGEVDEVDFACFGKNYPGEMSCPDDAFECGCFTGCADFTGDGVRDNVDMAVLAEQNGKCEGTPGFNSNADFDGDGCITAGESEIDLVCFERAPDSGLDCPRINLPPSKVTGVQAAGRTENVLISWTSNPYVTTGYIVKRSASSGGPYENIHPGSLTSTSYIDSNVEAGTTYYYIVIGSNEFGISEESDEASAVPGAPSDCDPTEDSFCDPDCFRSQDPDCLCNNDGTCESTWETESNCPNDCTESIEAPLAPINLEAKAGNKFVDLNWGVKLGQSPDKFNVYRKKASEYGYQKVSFTSSKTYRDSGLENDVTYEYVVTAVKQGTESIYSDAVLATPHAEPTGLNPPTNLSARFDQGAVKLSWSASSPQPDYYTVYRREENESSFSIVGSSTATRYEDNLVGGGKTYDYLVKSALLSGGESTGSQTVTVFVPSPNECSPAEDGVCDEDCSRLQDPDCVCNEDGTCEEGIEDAENCPKDCKEEGFPELGPLMDWGIGIGAVAVSVVLAAVFFSLKP